MQMTKPPNDNPAICEQEIVKNLLEQTLDTQNRTEISSAISTNLNTFSYKGFTSLYLKFIYLFLIFLID